MKVVIIDNYDSFTYNLSHLVKELGAEVTVLRNDKFSSLNFSSSIRLSSLPAPASLARQDCCWMLSRRTQARNPSWVSVWAIRP